MGERRPNRVKWLVGTPIPKDATESDVASHFERLESRLGRAEFIMDGHAEQERAWVMENTPGATSVEDDSERVMRYSAIAEGTADEEVETGDLPGKVEIDGSATVQPHSPFVVVDLKPAQMRLVFDLRNHLLFGVAPLPEKPDRVVDGLLSALNGLREVLRGSARDDVELGTADLKRDIRAKREQGCRIGYVRRIAFWGMVTIVAPVLWGVAKRWVPRVLLVVEWVRKWKRE